MTLIFKRNLDKVEINQYAKCQGQTSFPTKVIHCLYTHTLTRPNASPGPLTQTHISRLLFHDNLGKPALERLNESGF